MIGDILGLSYSILFIKIKILRRGQKQAPVPVQLRILREEYVGLCVL